MIDLMLFFVSALLAFLFDFSWVKRTYVNIKNVIWTNWELSLRLGFIFITVAESPKVHVSMSWFLGWFY